MDTYTVLVFYKGRMMPGSKRHFLFCVDLCSLFGADNSRPNHETWDAMSLEEQQAFTLQTAEYHSIPAAKLEPVAEDTTPPVVTPELIESNNAAPEELGVKIEYDGTVSPLPGNEIVVENGEAKVVSAPVSLPEVTSVEPSDPVVPAADGDGANVDSPADSDVSSTDPS